jgi:hypothetical protein
MRDGSTSAVSAAYISRQLYHRPISNAIGITCYDNIPEDLVSGMKRAATVAFHGGCGSSLWSLRKKKKGVHKVRCRIRVIYGRRGSGCCFSICSRNHIKSGESADLAVCRFSRPSSQSLPEFRGGVLTNASNWLPRTKAAVKSNATTGPEA